jgi:hypothetical protein
MYPTTYSPAKLKARHLDPWTSVVAVRADTRCSPLPTQYVRAWNPSRRNRMFRVIVMCSTYDELPVVPLHMLRV